MLVRLGILAALLPGLTTASTVADVLNALGGLDASAAVLAADLDADGFTIVNLATPSASTDAATKGYVDARFSGMDWKESVRAATTASITLSGEQTIDGVAVVAGDRVLVKNQGSAANGIYVASAGSWSRSADCNEDAEVTAGLTVYVSEGTANGNSLYMLTTNDAITVGSTTLTFTIVGSLQLGSSTPQALASSGSAGSASVAAKEDHVHPYTGLVIADGTGLTGQLATKGRKLSGENLSGTASLVTNKDVNYLNCGSGNGTFTFPAAPGDGSELVLKRFDTSNPGVNSCTLQRDGTDTIQQPDGQMVNSFTISNGDSLRYVSPVSGKWVFIA